MESTWPFDIPPNEAAITVRQIVLDGEPILLVVRDSEDGTWQFLTGKIFNVADGMIVGLQTILAQDATISQLADLPPGWQGVRDSIGAPWIRSEVSDE